jgi:hypothetical protein
MSEENDQPSIAYASFEGVVLWSGGQQLLRAGQSIDTNHPLYIERPDLFRGLAPVGAEISTQRDPGQVESTMLSGPAGGRVRKTAGQ